MFLNYTQEELDRNFNQRVWASNAQAVGVGHLSVPSPHAPINVFVHGGAWLNFTKDDFSFVAAPLAAAGITIVVLNFTNLPKVSLPDMIAQVRRGIRWAGQNATQFGGDPQALCVSAWSSGAHLAAMALVNTVEDRLPEGLVKLAFCVSGPYDLEPVMLSARSAYVKITKEQERPLSPRYNAAHYDTPFFIAYAENDTDEFRRQSQDFAAALDQAERLAGIMRFANLNHFELSETLGIKGSPLSDLLIERIRLAVR